MGAGSGFNQSVQSGISSISSVGTGISLVVSPDKIKSLIAGTNITIVDNGNDVTISATAEEITVVANYSALPDPTTVSGDFYWCSAAQGTKWLPGSLGGTYYSAGLYYSNGVSWEFLAVPYQATQAEVNTGTNDDTFVTPKTLTNATVITNKELLANKDATGGYAGLTLFKINFKNVANTFTSFLTNSNTASRTYTFQDSDDTIVGRATTDTLTNKTLTNAIVGTQSADDNSAKAASTAYVDTTSTKVLRPANNLSEVANIITSRNNLGMITKFINASNQTTTADTAQSITDLAFTVGASNTYGFMGFIKTGCSSTGGVKWTVTVPASATIYIAFIGQTTATNTVTNQRVEASGTLTSTAHIQSASSNTVTVVGTVITAGTSGTVQFQFAAGVSGQTATVYGSSSWIRMTTEV